MTVTERAIQPKPVSMPVESGNNTIQSVNEIEIRFNTIEGGCRVDTNVKNMIMFKEGISFKYDPANEEDRPSRSVTMKKNYKFDDPDLVRDINTMSLEKSRHENQFITLKDYEELSPKLAILYDKRSYFKMYVDLIAEENAVLSLVLIKSLTNPLWVRMMFFMLNLSLAFALNAIFFTDEYIDKRSSNVEENVNFL